MKYVTEVIKYRLTPNIFDLVPVEIPVNATREEAEVLRVDAMKNKRVYPEPVELDDDFVPQGPYDKWIPVDQVQMFQESGPCCITLKEDPDEIVHVRWSQADNWFSAYNSRTFWEREDILEVYLQEWPTEKMS
jgi:hypothetical protein